jgi:hypothetical protein
MCKVAQFNINLEDSKQLELWITCVEEIKRVLELDPEHFEANDWLLGFELIQERYDFSRPLVDLSGPSPDYLILTPMPDVVGTPPAIISSPTSSPANTPTHIVFISPLTMTAIAPTITQSTEITDETSMSETEFTDAEENIPSQNTTRIIIESGILLIGIVLILVIVGRTRKN